MEGKKNPFRKFVITLQLSRLSIPPLTACHLHVLRRHRLILEFNGPCIRIGGADPRMAKTGLINPVGRLDTRIEAKIPEPHVPGTWYMRKTRYLAIFIIESTACPWYDIC